MNLEIENIRNQETALNKGMALASRLESLLMEWEAYLPEFKKLMDYYSGPQWPKDVAASENGLLGDLRCGVLSQDAVYDFYSQQRMLNFKMAHTSLHFLEEK